MTSEEKRGYGLYGFGLRGEKKEEVRSTIEGFGETPWSIYDSCLLEESERSVPYDKSFRCLIPHREGEKNKNLKEYIEELLRQKRRRAIGIDFGGPGSRLFEGFSRGFFGRTLGVTLRDQREDERKIKDRRNIHTVIGGNMFERKTRRKVEKWLKGRKADVIFERMKGGLNYVAENDIRFLREVLKAAYAILAEEGVMFLEYRWVSGDPWNWKILQAWSSRVNDEYRGSLEIMWGSSETVFMLRKFKGAPEKLPGIELFRRPTKEQLRPGYPTVKE
jgi:hypothetical protein